MPLALSDPAPTFVAGLGRQRSSSPTQLDSPRRFPSSHPLSAWALHVPLGKLHTERQVPVDEATRRILDRILSLRALFRPSRSEKPPSYLLPRRGRSRETWIAILRKTLANAARTAVYTTSVTPHRLRHTFATTMLRLGVI
jgi:site-specific recombinase XerD